MRLTQWLEVIDGSKGFLGDNGKLFCRDIETGFIPQPGVDDVILWTNDDNAADGPMWQLKRRYMDNSGFWHIELTKMILNPNEVWVDSMRLRLAGGRSIIVESSWWTQSDGDPIPKLLEAGWRKF